MSGINQLTYPCQKVFDAKSATGVYWVLPEHLEGLSLEWTVYVTFSHTSDSGGLSFESAPFRNYQGTWALIGSAIAWSAIDKCHMLNFTGLLQSARLRLSTTVTTGSMDVYVMAANKT